MTATTPTTEAKTMKGEVDVLAVIESERRMRVRNANRERARGNEAKAREFDCRAAELGAAKSFVAELIGAAEDARSALFSCIDALSSDEQSDHDALARVTAALSRLTGAA